METNVSGIRIGELLPLLAKQADMYSIIRSMTHGNNGHETRPTSCKPTQPGGRLVYPCVGAVVSLTKGYDAGYKGLIPPYVVLTEPQDVSMRPISGSRYKPFATGGNPAQTPFAVEGVVAPGCHEQRQKSRRELMHHLDTLAQAMRRIRKSRPPRSGKHGLRHDSGDGAKVFDLSQEKQELRDRYGKSKFGQSCLVARRLVERGVRMCDQLCGLDTHKENFQAIAAAARHGQRVFDAASGFVRSGLLDSTSSGGGEFGRTPKIQWEAP